jgi:hypothetical protein
MKSVISSYGKAGVVPDTRTLLFFVSRFSRWPHQRAGFSLWR